MAIYQAYDLRGLYPQEINEDLAYQLGQALPHYFKKKQIAVGRDMRLSSPVLTNALIKGIRQQNADVFDLGLVGTEIVSFASGFYHWATVMITASHNEPNRNGFKICGPGARQIAAETGLPQLVKLLDRNWVQPKHRGRVIKKNVWSNFKKYIFSLVQLDQLRPLKIVVDAGNGMAGKIVPFIFKDLPLKIVPMYFELDGAFPNHLPDPTLPQVLEACQQQVKAKKADLGVVFDGDADRVVLIDERGEVVDNSLTIALMSREFLRKNPGATIVYNAVCSRIVPEVIGQFKGKAVRCPVGYANVKKAMKNHQAIFGGEASGHYMYKSFYFAESAILSCLLILGIISREKRPFFKIVQPFKKYVYEVIPFDLNNKKLKEILPKKFAKEFSDGQQDWLDGLTVNYPEWWFNLRGSGTAPIMRFTIEAKTRKLLEQKKKHLLTLLKEIKDKEIKDVK